MFLKFYLQNAAERQQCLGHLENARKEAVNVVSHSHTVSIDSSNAAALQSLLESTRSLTESVNAIVEILGREAPWQRECDAALRQIQVFIFDNLMKIDLKTSVYMCFGQYFFFCSEYYNLNYQYYI